MTPDTFADIFRRHSRPLQPLPSGETPVLRKLGGIRAVLFDVYGTMFVSGSGEVGTTAEAVCRRSFDEALRAMGIDFSGSVAGGVEYLFRAIEASHAESRLAGIDYPEVDIVEIWRQVVAELCRQGVVEPSDRDTIDLRMLAVQYEARANPCWPMPHLRKCLAELHRAGVLLGIISNAQFYTPELIEAFLDGPQGTVAQTDEKAGKGNTVPVGAVLGPPDESPGFDPRLQYYSYQYGRAKPGLELFRLAAEELGSRGIGPSEVLYVGNDMLNDIFPAQKLGFHTALFAGDARSLRRREGDPRPAGIVPDLVLTELNELLECMIT